ncbi:protein kinase domain-containing protein [Nannocystaceae bacterium ST9]
MDLPLSGYREVRLLRASRRAQVYEAVRNSDGRPVIAKVSEFGSEELESRVEHEFALVRALDVEGVVRALDLQRVGDQWVLLLERVPGVDLATYAGGHALALDEFLDIAIQLANILARVHERRIIHRDIKPTNVLIDPDTGRVSLADFGISVLLESERRHIYDPEVLEGTLPYISPEQTGRTGRPVDFRSDLYSLGVTFYELLTGRRPFAQTAPLELIHAHLARVPDPPRLRRPDLPEPLDRLVVKLLAKASEHRYQTARGLAADLQRIFARLSEGDSGTSFVLGREDFSRELQLPHQLYGREQERGEIVGELARVTRTGQPRMLVLVGPAGIGKSALIADVEGEAARFGSYVAHGRFEATRDRPYAAFGEAFGGLVEQLLTESETRLSRWRERLSESLGAIAGVVVDMVPALALVLGESPPLALLEPHEARNRVQLAVARFLAVFCAEPGTSLVLVLEDLQWADQSSLDLLASLMLAARRSALLVLASQREVDQGHPLRGLFARLPESRRARLELGPLAGAAVERLLADTLGRSPTEVARLATRVARKTDNNPLFIRQLLTHLAKAELMTPSERGWVWDDEAIEAADIPADVLAVMHAKLAGLPEHARALIQRAACIGERFDLAGLEVVVDEPEAKLTATLYDLVDAGLIDQRGGEYRFAHHGIREAALAGADEDLRPRLRWQIGRHQLATLDPSGERLFEIVDHLDAGLASVELDLAGRVELAELNARAGRRALARVAHDAALRYLEQGIALVGEQREAVARLGARAPDYALLVELHFARAQVLAVRDGAIRAESTFAALLAWPLRPAEYGRIAARWINQLTLEGRTREAVEFGFVALARFGWHPAHSPGKTRTLVALTWTWLRVRALDVERFVDLPRRSDEHASAAMEILIPTKNAAYVIDSHAYVALVCMHVRGLLRHGNHPSASLALAQLATCVGSRLGQVDDAIRLAEVALALSQRFDPGPTRVRVEAAVDLFVTHLGRPFAEPLARLEGLQIRALEAGDFLWAGYAGSLALSMHVEVGTHLRVLRRMSERFTSELGTRVTREANVVAATVRGLALALAPDDDAAQVEAWAGLDPERPEARVSRYALFVTLANRALAAVLLGRPGEALTACLAMIDTIEQVLFGSWAIPRVALTTLVAAHVLRESGEPLPAGVARARRKARAILRSWAAHSNANYRHYVDLAEGLELARRARWPAALRSLERARVGAAGQGCRWVEWLAGERLAALAEFTGVSGLAIGARSQTEDARTTWGARRERYEPSESLDSRVLGDSQTIGDSAGASTSRGRLSTSEHSSSRQLAGSGALDFDSVLRSVAAIGADLRLDQVIASVLDAAVTNAGADHGLLVLERDGVLGLVAKHEIDGERLVFGKPLPLSEAKSHAPTSVIHFVLRTEQSLVLDVVESDPRFADDPYLQSAGVRSLIGMPIVKGRRTLGALVLENRLSSHGFTPERLEVLQLIAGQAASALDHARVHDALREGEARWRSLVAGAPDLIALLDANGELEFVNRRLERSDQELFARSPEIGEWRDAVASVLREGTVRELELELPRPGGPSRWYVARLAPVDIELDQAGGTTRLRKAIAIATDITARKQAEAEKRELEAQMRQQQRLESIGTLAAGVAHEINNPIQGILNYAELIGESPTNAALVEEFAGEITSESNRVASIVRNLLAFSRHEGEGPSAAVDLAELVDATLSLVRAVMRKDQIALRVAIPSGLPRARCRAQQIQQIVMNLVTNARDALNIAYAGYHEHKWIEIRAEFRAPRTLRLIVEDSGPGIPSEVLPHVFDPFFTTKGRDQGTGLGLSVSHGIAREHGGDLTVDSRVGEGTRFFLDLPAAEPSE